MAEEAADPVGTALLKFAEARRSRLEELDADRLGAIDHLVHLGLHLNDKGVLAQAYTALGDELMFQGDAKNAANRYREALSQIGDCDIPTLGVWAWRALYKRQQEEPDQG